MTTETKVAVSEPPIPAVGKPTVAVVYTRPETVLEDISRAMEMAGVRDALAPDIETLLIRFCGGICPCVGVALAGSAFALNECGVDDLELTVLCFTAVDVETCVVQLRFGYPFENNPCIGAFCSEMG